MAKPHACHIAERCATTRDPLLATVRQDNRKGRTHACQNSEVFATTRVTGVSKTEQTEWKLAAIANCRQCALVAN